MDAASGAAVMALNISPGDHILDLCAAPGNHTFTFSTLAIYIFLTYFFILIHTILSVEWIKRCI